MQRQYEARRISKRRAEEVKKSGALSGAILVGTFNGFIIVEPVGANLGDGPAFSPQEADYELQPVWHLGPKTTLLEARGRLGLEGNAARRLAHSGA